LERIKKDYSSTKDKLFDDLNSSLQEFTRAEFNDWIKRGWFDEREIDGTNYFFNASVSNLTSAIPNLTRGERYLWTRGSMNAFCVDTVTAIKKASSAEKTPYVLPKTMLVTMDVTRQEQCRACGRNHPRVGAHSAAVSVSIRFQTDLKFRETKSHRLGGQRHPVHLF